MIIAPKERTVIRDLAKKQFEYSNLPKMQELTRLWYDHNDLRGKRPMFTIETWTFNQEIPREYKCTSNIACQIEDAFISAFANHEYIGDDVVIPPFFPVRIKNWFQPFGIDVEAIYAPNSIGHQFKHKIKNLEENFSMLEKSEYGTLGREETDQYKKLLEDIFGDILPVEVVGDGLSASPTQNIVHIMSMENMLLSICDYPELFHKLMNQLTDDYMECFKWFESEKLLLPTSSYGHVGQGSFCFAKTLPSGGEITTKNIWGYMDSQETVGISPDMFNEFIFPYYKKISDMFGLLSYGCLFR